MRIFSLKTFFNRLNILKFLFYIFPVAMLTSSGYITAYTSILTIYILYYFFYYKIRINLSILDYLIIIFFLISIISTLRNIGLIGSFMFFKSILDLRFAILFFAIRNLLNNKIINIKLFCIVSLICTIFVSSDIFLQVFYGKNVLGYPEIDGRYGGVFGKEAIAGSYIQKFSLVSILTIFLLKKKNKYNFILTIFTINFLGLGILMTLDRMPYIIYIFSITILIILLKKFRLRFLLSLFLICSIFLFFFNNYVKIKNKYLYLEISKIQKNFSANNKIIENKLEDKINDNLSSGYLKIYNAAYKIFLNNPFIGSGVKSFWPECDKLQTSSVKNISCSTHPHNIYLEILVNQGIIGILIFISFIIILLKMNYLDILLCRITVEKKLLATFFLTLIISELIPLRSYGSIFQTVNGTIFWFFLALVSSKPFVKNI
jgi:O-antigen ligase